VIAPLTRLHGRYRYSLILLRAMVATDFKLRYQASILGYLWTLLRPLALFTILYLVFARLLQIGGDVPYYAVYLLFGIVIWGFFAETTSQGLASLVGRAELLRKISFPRYVVVVSVGVSALISFGLSMVVMLLFVVIARIPVGADVLWLPLLFVELVAFSLSTAFFLSALYVRFRDMSYIWEVTAQAAFYATPIIYPLSLIEQQSVWAARILLLNPMAQIIQDARYCLVTTQTDTMTQVFGTPWARLIPVTITVVMVLASIGFFRRHSPSFAEEA
jgi:ABC-2 type transport system permease protein